MDKASGKRESAFWGVMWVIALDVVFGAVILGLLLGAGLFIAMFNSMSWPGSPEMAMLVRVDWGIFLVGLPLLWLLMQIGPRDEVSSESAQGEMPAAGSMSRGE